MPTKLMPVILFIKYMLYTCQYNVYTNL